MKGAPKSGLERITESLPIEAGPFTASPITAPITAAPSEEG